MSDSPNMLAVIEKAATSPEIDVDKMERLLDMQLRIIARDAEAAYNQAMSEVQSELGRIETDSTNDQTRSRYASYAQLDRAIRPNYTRHGFALSFGTADCPIESSIRVVCKVSHKGGHSEKYQIDMPADGKGAKGGDVMTRTHATGSATQYGQRYLLKLIFNLAIGKDDDGNMAAKVPVTDEMADEIKDLIDDTGSDLKAFLRVFSTPSVDEMDIRHYPKAIQLLRKKRGNS